MKRTFAYPLGFVGTDIVTGFSGRITGRADYITGCRQYCLQPDLMGGKFEEPRWFDEERLRVPADQSGLPELIPTRTGGPSSAASAAPAR